MPNAPQSPPPANPPPRRKPSSLVGLGVLAAWVAVGALLARGLGPTGPLTFAFVMIGWVLAVMAHEFGHAAVGWLAGDRTVAEKGYLSFDPRAYGDLGVSLVIPLLALALGGIGFPGGAVYLRHDLMRTPLWRAAASLAGPFATLLVLLALTTGLWVWAGFGAAGPLFPALTVLAFLQAMALVLNLLPIPGLDGFGAIRPFLPPRWGPALQKAEGLGMVLLFLALFVVGEARQALFALVGVICQGLGLDLYALQAGWQAFRFWA